MILLNGKEEFVGLTIGGYNRSYNSSMDFTSFATFVFDVAKGKAVPVSLGNDFNGMCGVATFVVDLLPEYKAILAANEAAKAAADHAKYLEKEVAETLARKTAFDERMLLGKVVTVAKGKDAGKTGKTFWLSQYSGKWGYKIGVAVDDARDAKGFYTNVIWTFTKKVSEVAVAAI